MKTMEKTIDIDLIQLSKETYPRLGVSENVVETYASNMEAGVKFDLLVVQKDTYKLIDGWHRYQAYKRLKIKKVEVEILDIPDSDLRLEAVKRNVKHGQRLTKRELHTSIVLLRFEDKKGLKEIANTVNLSEVRVSQICKEYKSTPRLFFNNLNSLDSKVDLRVKVDKHKRAEILQDLTAGMSGTKVAEKHKVSEATVSLVKKEDSLWLSAPVYIRMGPHRTQLMFNIAFANKLLTKARFEFKEDGIIVRNSNEGKKPFVIAKFREDFFIQYKVRRPIDGYAKSDISARALLKDFEGDWMEMALIDEYTWKFRDSRAYYGTGLVKEQKYPELDWREFEDRTPKPKMDIYGIPETCTVKALIDRFEFPRKEKGTLRLKMEKKDTKLIGSYCQEEDWNCSKTLELQSLKRVDNAEAVVDLHILDEILKVIPDPLAIGMWSDHTSLALGMTTHPSVSVCFII